MHDIRSHQRKIETFTARWERPALRWLAAHMPAWVNSDMLTGVGVVGSLIIFLGYSLSDQSRWFLWLASLGFVINWFGDSLDGTLARFRKKERPIYGFYIDHVVDLYDEALVFLGLGISPLVRFDLACLGLIGYLMLSVIAFLYQLVQGEFILSYGRLGPTEARLIAIGANLLVFFVGNPVLAWFGWNLSVFDWVMVGIIGLLASIIVTTTYKQARFLAKIDRPGA